MSASILHFNSRYELPHILNERGLLGTAVEIGVHVGWHAQKFRAAWKGALFIGVDPYTVYEGADSDQATHDEYYEHAQRALAGTASELWRRTSLDAADLFLNRKRADFVYLDGDHSYEAARADIAAWWPIIKSGGILAGHDYVADGWHVRNEPHKAYATKAEALKHGEGVAEFGVMRAVNEAFGAKVISLSAPGADNDFRTWALVKP